MPLLAGAAQLMHIQDARMQHVAHNMANVDTPGFRKMMLVQRAQGTQSVVGTRGGAVKHADGDMDVALHGDGFLTLQNADGRVALTRNGHLTRGADGTLLSGGLPVLGEEGPMRVAPGKAEVRPDGTIWQGDQRVGKLRLSTSTSMAPVGNGVYVTSEAPKPAIGTSLEIGALENSNVESLREITHMMDALRVFEMSQKLALTDSEIRKKLCDEVGRSR